MTESRPPQPSRRLRGWKLAVVIGSTVLLLLIGLIALPFIVADSFERVVDRARAAGIPGSPSETGRQGHPRHLRITGEINTLMRGLLLYQPQYPNTRYYSMAPHTERMRLYRALPAASVIRAEELARELAGTTWEARPLPWSRNYHEFSVCNLVYLLCDRWVVDQPADPDADAALLLDAAQACDPLWGIRVMALNRVLLVLRMRLGEITDRVGLAERLRDLAQGLRSEMVRAYEVEFALAADDLRNPWKAFKDRGLVIPRWVEIPFALRAVCRLGAARYLGRELDWLTVVRGESDPVALRLAFIDRHPSERSAAYMIALLLDPDYSSGLRTPTNGFHWKLRWVNSVMPAQCLAWSLDGQNLPIDLLDPAKAPLRKLERDGRTIALYSVGWDGYDNGGDDKADMVWWLEPDPALPAGL